MNLQGANIAVTGGAGFVGSQLVDALVKRGAVVTVFDNLSRGHMDNVYAAKTLECIDLASRVPNLRGYDAVYHMAAKVAGIEYNRVHQLDMLQSNLAINYHVMQAIRKFIPERAIICSTACVYPHDAPIPTPESAADVCDPEPTNYGYGVAKWLLEQQGKLLARESRTAVVVTRFSNCFGLRDYYDHETSHVAPAIIRRVMEGESPLTVWGTGSQTRVLVDTREVAEALCRLAECDMPSRLEVFNVGHSQQVSMTNLARAILDEAGCAGREIVYDTKKPDGYPARQSDCSKLERVTGYRMGNIQLRQTLRDMITDYQAQKKRGWLGE